MANGPSQHPVPTPSIPDATSLRVARQHRAALLRKIQLFERAIAAPAADPHWRHRVRVRLGGLRAAFAEHVVVTEGPDGLYAELLEHAPRLARGVHVLIREHGAVVAAMSALQRWADLPETTAEQLRGWASDLLRELSRHRQRGADLVYQAYQLDIGGET
jgi:antitoxin (DNA-binding transcriptional repressor) of toxin-antitoxin stability system